MKDIRFSLYTFGARGKPGGTELAPMSTTSSLKVAMRFSASAGQSVLLRLRTNSFIQRSQIRFLSVYPEENEYLFPPLTYLQPDGEPQKLHVDAAVFTVLDVVPHWPGA
eukprot:3509245-Prymnesium_polylepis.1